MQTVLSRFNKEAQNKCELERFISLELPLQTERSCICNGTWSCDVRSAGCKYVKPLRLVESMSACKLFFRVTDLS